MSRRPRRSPTAALRHDRRSQALLGDHATAAAEALAGYENVAYMTVGEKRVGGVGAGRAALIAYVTEKREMDDARQIPDSVTIDLPDGTQATIPTDVVELPSPPKTLGMRAGHVILAADNDFGICGFTFRRGPTNYAVTNAHVVANMLTGMFPGEPDVQDPGTLQRRRIGDTIYASQFAQNVPTDEDMAIIRADRVPVDPLGISAEAHPISGLSNFGATRASQYWYKINGGKLICRSPEPVLGNAIIRVDNGRFIYRRFWHLNVTQGASAPGHSGALICAGSGTNIIACGLLFGGAPPNYVYAFPMDDVFRRVEDRLSEQGL